jgi:DNA-binding NarL/FixJ family response regulator
MRLVVADSSVVSRERLIRLLAELKGVEIAGQASDMPEAKDLVEKLKPDVMIMDLGRSRHKRLKRTDVKLLLDFKKLHPAPKVILLANSLSPELRADCIAGGADYFFDKSAEIEKVASVLKGIHRVMDAG